jgi:plasmid stabilization system protein ParE
MSYRVVYTDAFLADVRDHLAHLRRERVAERVIEDWYTKLFDRLDDLAVWPLSCVVSEPYTRDAGRTTHKLNVGDYLVFYQVDDEHRRVERVAFFHGSKDWKH